jgi:hypothetical protein
VKIDITGTLGEINFLGRGGKITGRADMDEIVVGFTLEGSSKGKPVAISFEDAVDTALFTIDLTPDQAEEFAKALLDTAVYARERSKKVT